MKIVKKLTVLMLIVSILIPNISMAQSLSDIEESVYKSEINKLVEEGIINGYPDGTFKPEGNITRGEFAKVLSLALKLESDSNASEKFKDVKGLWHEGYIGAIVNEGLMIGRTEDTFDPDNNITKEELAVVLVRAFKLDDLLEGIEDIATKVDDMDKVADWAKPSVILVTDIGLMDLTKSTEGNMFLPQNLGDRQFVAKLTYELVLNIKAYDKAINELKSNIQNKKDDKQKLNEIDKEKKKDDTKLPIDKPEQPKGPDKPTEPKEPEKPTPPVVTAPSEAEIVAKYESELSALESSAWSQLDALMDQAWAEVDDGASMREVYSKYESIAKDLESDIDAQVSAIISSMEKELAEYGYNSNASSDLYNQYQSAKPSY